MQTRLIFAKRGFTATITTHFLTLLVLPAFFLSARLFLEFLTASSVCMAILMARGKRGFVQNGFK